MSLGSRDEVDSEDDVVVLAAPVARDETHLLGVRHVQCGVVEHEDSALQVDEGLGLPPERVPVLGEPREEAVERVVRLILGSILARRSGLTPGRLGAHEDPLGCNQVVDVVVIVDLRRIHRPRCWETALREAILNALHHRACRVQPRNS